MYSFMRFAHAGAGIGPEFGENFIAGSSTPEYWHSAANEGWVAVNTTGGVKQGGVRHVCCSSAPQASPSTGTAPAVGCAAGTIDSGSVSAWLQCVAAAQRRPQFVLAMPFGHSTILRSAKQRR